MPQIIEQIKNVAAKFVSQDKKINIISHYDSVIGDQKVLVRIDKYLRRMTLNDLFEYCSKNFKIKKRIDGKYFVNPKKIMMFSINKKNKIILSEIKTLIKHKVRKEIYEVGTKIGKVKVTKDHSLMKLEDGELCHESPSNINFVASPRYYPFQKYSPKINLLKHKEILPLFIKSQNFLYIKHSPVKAKIPIEIKLDETFLTFLGMWLADGSSCKSKRSYNVNISCYEDKECKKIINKIAALFCASVCETDKGITAIINSKALYNILKYLNFEGTAKTKRVPSLMFNLKENLMAAFLRGYFSGDGTISKGDVNITSFSKNLIEDTQTLLLFFGIRSCIRKEKGGYKLSINSKEMKEKFLKKIGFLQTYKNKKVEITNTTNYPDLIPLSKKLINKLIGEISFKEKKYIKRIIQKNRYLNKKWLTKLKLNQKIKKEISKIITNDIFSEEKKYFKVVSKNKNIGIYDIETETGNFICENLVLKNTDGITSASIMASALQRLDKNFSIKIVKQLEKEAIRVFKKNELLLVLDLGSGSISELGKLDNQVYIIDHHEINKNIPVPENINIINPHLYNEEDLSGACLTYLFAKDINKENKDLANLAIIGMVGDMLEKNIGKIGNTIIEDAEMLIKKGILLYPATRPLNKTLEYSSSIFIPGVTGSPSGAINLLREAGIEKKEGKYKSLIELNEEEMSKLITSILLRRSDKNIEDFIGNIYLVKFLNQLEDARELSAMINACSRLEYSNIALSLCMGNKTARKKAEQIYVDYKQHLISGLNFVANHKKIEGDNYVIINARSNIKDTIIGTIASMLSMSSLYKEGTAIITMAHNQDKIKISGRIAGRNGRNIREILDSVVKEIGGESGGHALAAGCLISREKEKEFVELLKKRLEIEMIKI